MGPKGCASDWPDCSGCAGTSQFSDYTNSDPISVIKTGMLSTTILTPNTMVPTATYGTQLTQMPQVASSANTPSHSGPFISAHRLPFSK